MTCYSFTRYQSSEARLKKSWGLLGVILACALSEDISWILTITQNLRPIIVLSQRIAWAFSNMEYLTLYIFLEHLTTKDFRFKFHDYLALTLCLSTFLALLFISIFQYDVINPAHRLLEYRLYTLSICNIFLCLFMSLTSVLHNLKRSDTPKILHHQINVLIGYILVPHTIFIALSVLPIPVMAAAQALLNQHLFIAINDILYLLALYFCAQKILGLRFLNTTEHVQAPKGYNFIYDFRKVLGQLGQITSMEELQQITKQFFNQAFRIAPRAVHLYLRPYNQTYINTDEDTPIVSCDTLPAIEHFICADNSAPLLRYCLKAHVLIRDELDFDYFYEEQPHQKQLIALLTHVNADLFIPIYQHHTIIAYIVVQHGSRPADLFSNVERDEMYVFSKYLSNIIYLLQNRNLPLLIKREREISEELHVKQQEIVHYKESIRTLLKSATQHHVGLVYYRKRALVWANDTIRQMLDIQTMYEVHPLYTPALLQLAQDVLKYQAERTISLHDPHGRLITCSALQGPEKTQVIIFACYPNLADTLIIPFDQLKDISFWEYALYLETTESGKLINELIPGSTPALIAFKMDLLKISLSRKATLLELPEDDVNPIVQIIHHISLCTTLRTITPLRHEQGNEVGIQLFGIEYDPNGIAQEGLFATLHETGTILINNIELLSAETQNRLAAFFITGNFQPFKSDRRIHSSVRIICTTNAHIKQLVEQHQFSSELYRVLHSNSLTLPSLTTLPRHELEQLAQQVTQKTLQTHELRSLVALNARDTADIIKQSPHSITTLKRQIQHTLTKKAAKQKLDHLIMIDQSTLDFPTDIPYEVTKALKMGKAALKDKRLFLLLWNTFQSQAKIATLLRVNRSSVNRRCKEYAVITE